MADNNDNELAKFAEWAFFEEVEPAQEVLDMLIQGEQVYSAFRTIRDTATFTSHRLIVRDTQGITGAKVETYSVPWKSIEMWSIETAGMLDLIAEVELWTRVGNIKINLHYGADVDKINNLISAFVLPR